MLPLPQDIQFNATARRILFSNPMVWLLALVVLVHVGSFVPAIFAQREYLSKDQEFKELWNTGGSMSLAAQGIEPTRQEEQTRREAYMRTYVDRSFFYNAWMVPHWTSGIAFFTAWIFQPGWLSLFLVVAVLLYLGLWLPARIPGFLPAMLTIGFAMAGTFAYYALVGVMMERHGELPYCGLSMVAAAGLGILVRSHSSQIPIRYYWVEWNTLLLHPYVFAGIWIALDFVVQVVVNPINYGWVFALDLVAVGIGAALGSRIPAPKTTVRQSFRTTNLDPLAPVRAHLQEGWRLADLLELEAALGEIDQGLKMLLRNPKPDPELIEQTFLRMMSTKNPLPVSPQQWYEWGVRLTESNFPPLAIQCLEQAVKAPGASTDLARPAVVQAAELRIRHSIQPRESIPWLQRVVKARADDLLGRKATQLLESLSA